MSPDIALKAFTEVENISRIAAFDLFGTLIKPRSGRKNPLYGKDWCFANEGIVNKLRELVDGMEYSLFIFANHEPNLSVDDLTNILSDMAQKVRREFTFIIGLKRGFYKPRNTMWLYAK